MKSNYLVLIWFIIYDKWFKMINLDRNLKREEQLKLFNRQSMVANDENNVSLNTTQSLD
jgi:hypothetical protein